MDPDRNLFPSGSYEVILYDCCWVIIQLKVLDGHGLFEYIFFNRTVVDSNRKLFPQGHMRSFCMHTCH